VNDDSLNLPRYEGWTENNQPGPALAAGLNLFEIQADHRRDGLRFLEKRQYGKQHITLF
jgi:hypothetical protein